MAINFEPVPNINTKNISGGAEDDEEENFEYDENDIDPGFKYDVKVKVIGIGGGGGNAVEHMASEGIKDVSFVVVNTDVPALQKKDKKLMRRVQIGKKISHGRGAGGNPEIGAEAALEDRKEIEKQLKGTTLLFITAGMGGGSGTGAAPVIAEIAQEMGILTVGVVTKPFEFEGASKMNTALKGIAKMREHVDSLVIIPNEKLLTLDERNLGVRDAFKKVDNVLLDAVRGITETLNETAEINVDFSDLEATMKKSGDAHIAISSAKGDKRIEDTIYQLVNCPLLETTIANTTRLLVNVTTNGNNFSTTELDQLMSSLKEVSHPDVNIIFGLMFDSREEAEETIRVTLIATGFADSDNTASVVRATPNVPPPQSAPRVPVSAQAAPRPSSAATDFVASAHASAQKPSPLLTREIARETRQPATAAGISRGDRPSMDVLDTQPLSSQSRDDDDDIYKSIADIFGDGKSYRN